MRERAVRISSTMPSAKYSCSASPLEFAKGSTAIDGLFGSASLGHADGAEIRSKCSRDTRTGRTMFFGCRSPRSSKARSSLPAASSCTRADTQIQPERQELFLSGLRLAAGEQRIDHAYELHRQPVAGGLDHAAAMSVNLPIDQLGADCLLPIKRPLLVRADRSGIAGDISGQDCGKPACDALLGHGSAPEAIPKRNLPRHGAHDTKSR
jgi:hypothetical protein